MIRAALLLASLAAAESCVSALVPVHALPTPKKPGKPAQRDVRFEDAAACLAGGEMQQRVLMFALEDCVPPLAIGVESTPRRGSMPAPEVRVFDRDGKQIAAYDFAQFRHCGASYALTVFLNDTAAAGGRPAVAADPATLGRRSTLLTSEAYYAPIITPVALWNFYGSNEGRYEFAFAESGMVRVKVESGAARAIE